MKAKYCQANLIDELPRLVDRAISLLRTHEPPEGYVLCDSGGKDSCVSLALAQMAGVRFRSIYNVTTIDPPELIYFLRRHHPETVWARNPKWNFFTALVSKGFPTRISRWCCHEFKHGRNEPGSTVLRGIRAEESARRSRAWLESGVLREPAGVCYVHPIFYWGSDDVWAFIQQYHVPYCELYDQGWHRIGCVGCPLSRRSRERDFARWPRIEAGWQRAFRRLWQSRVASFAARGEVWPGVARWGTWEGMWSWWLADRVPDRELVVLAQGELFGDEP